MYPARLSLLLLCLLSCKGDAPPIDTDTDTDPIDTGDTGPELCGSANRELPDGLIELAYDDGVGAADMSGQTWSIDGKLIAEMVLNETVAFQLEHPAKVHAISVQFANLPAEFDPLDEVTLGLYPDFGHNGFDFWAEPLWTGTRCMEDVADGEWVTYVLDEPVAVDHPGLIHAGHQRQDNNDLAVLFDAGALSTDCATWGDCRSALNTPEDGTDQYYPGYSFPFQYDYLIRLHVEVTEQADPAQAWFQDATGELSIGNRQAWGDYDNDGWDDLLANGSLFHNEAGTLTAVTSPFVGVGVSGGVWGDYDNDGCLDVFLFAESYTAGDSLWRGDCGGGFENTTASAGISDVQSYNQCEGNAAYVNTPSAAAAWWDLNGDGLLDLFVGGFQCWDDRKGYLDQVFVNQGGGVFSELTGQDGFLSARYANRGANPADADGDGDVDLVTNDYTLHRNLFYDNQGDGTVKETARSVGLAGHNDSGYYGHSIGTAWGDLDNDGDLDLIEANLAHPRYWHFSDQTRVLMNDGGDFADAQGDWDDPWPDTGLRYQETHSVPLLADFDQDGNLDLVISAVYVGRPTDFYFGHGDGTFSLDSYHAGITRDNGWGVAATDIDHDGDMDLSISGHIFENRMPDAGHWLQVRAVGDEQANRMGIGATVRVASAQGERIRHVQGGSGQGCQDSQTVHFGLGDDIEVEWIEVTFPGQAPQRFSGPFDVDQRLWLMESGTVAAGWAPPS